MKTKGFELSSLTIMHFDFVRGLYDSGIIDDKLLSELSQEALKGNVPKQAENILYPVTLELVELVTNQYRSGRSKIAVYKDKKGQRYVAADFI